MRAKNTRWLLALVTALIGVSCTSAPRSPQPPQQPTVSSPNIQSASPQRKASQEAANVQLLTKLRAYAPQSTTEKEFWQDDWNAEGPYDGIIGIIAFKKQDGTNEYILGYYDSPATLDGYARHVVRDGASFLLESENSLYNPPYIRDFANARRVLICIITFKNNMLVSIKWSKDYNTDK